MERCDALIVGGGPAGSTCARALRIAGWNVTLIDRARFPRDKVCGGWITPEVFPLLDLEPDAYRASGATLQEIRGFRTSVIGGPSIETRYDGVVSYAIRRCEFDHFLLRRARVRVLEDMALLTLRRKNHLWIAGDRIAAPVVIGAGGHFCPVARHVQQGRDRARLVIAKEIEFRADSPGSIAADLPELLFCRDLDGYGWCVRKGAYLNVGIGRRAHHGFATEVREFVELLRRTGRVPDLAGAGWRGHAYFASGAGVRPVAAAGVVLAGDAAGLAYPESGEGIRPAIESGRLAAEVLIAADGRYGYDDLQPYEEIVHSRHRPSAPVALPLRPIMAAAGRALLRSPAFTRHIVLNRWFLRAGAGPGPAPREIDGAVRMKRRRSSHVPS